MIAKVLLLTILTYGGQGNYPHDSLVDLKVVDSTKSCTILTQHLDSVSDSKLDLLSMDKLAPVQVGEVGRCPVLAGKVIPQFWEEIKTDSAYLDNLMVASATIKDTRIESALKRTVHDSTKDYWVRVAAFHALLAYDRGVVARVTGHPEAYLEHREKIRRVRMAKQPKETWFISTWMAPAQKIEQIDGEEPLMPDFKKRLIAYMQLFLRELFPDADGRFKSDNAENLYDHIKSIAEEYDEKKKHLL